MLKENACISNICKEQAGRQAKRAQMREQCGLEEEVWMHWEAGLHQGLATGTQSPENQRVLEDLTVVYDRAVHAWP